MSGIPKDPKGWYQVCYSKDATDPSQDETVLDVLANTFEDAEELAQQCAHPGEEWIMTKLAGTAEDYRMLHDE